MGPVEAAGFERPTNLTVSVTVAENEVAAAVVDGVRLFGDSLRFWLTIGLAEAAVGQNLQPMTVAFPHDDQHTVVTVDITVDDAPQRYRSPAYSAGRSDGRLGIRGGSGWGTRWETDFWLPVAPVDHFEVALDWPAGHLAGSARIPTSPNCRHRAGSDSERG